MKTVHLTDAEYAALIETMKRAASLGNCEYVALHGSRRKAAQMDVKLEQERMTDSSYNHFKLIYMILEREESMGWIGHIATYVKLKLGLSIY